MRIRDKVELKNLLLDVIITLLAIQYIDITEFVESSLHLVIYFIILVQSFAVFLVWGDESFGEELVDDKKRTFLSKLKIHITTAVTGFVMFSWILGVLWILVPIEYLNNRGEDYVWANRISIVVCVLNGLIILVRQFANLSDVEIKKIERWRRLPDQKKTTAEKIIIPIYSFFIYGNIGNRSIRNWLAYILIFAFLIYTETLFEILYSDPPVHRSMIVLAILFSYFPMRLLLLIKPPFSLIEVLSASTAFGVFIYMLLF